jgi:MarR family transcriptional regulator for hemolysin
VDGAGEEERDDFDEWSSNFADFYPDKSRLNLEFRTSRLLVMASRSWVYRIDNKLRGATGQSRARWQVLFTMAFAEQPVTMTAICKRVRVQWPTMVRVVEGMERDGLLAREGNPADRRSKLLHLTPRGTALIREIQPILDHERAQLLAGLNDEELAMCARLLEKIFEAAIAR